MQRSSLAMRRFYAAFYQWTVRSSTPARNCIGGNIVPLRETHSTRKKKAPKRAGGRNSKDHSEREQGARDRKDQEEESTALTALEHRDQKTLHFFGQDAKFGNGEEQSSWNPATPSFMDSREENVDPVEEEGFRDKSKILRTIPVSSYDDIPRGSLKAWKFEIRARSRDKVSVELSLPNVVIKMKSLHDALKGHDATIEFPWESVLRKSRTVPYPVIISGTFNRVNDAWGKIYDASKSRNGELKSEYKAGPDVKEKESDFLVCWSSKVHELGRTKVVADFCIPETIWRLMLRSGGIEFIEKWFAVDVEPSNLSSNDVRQIHLTGASVNVWRAQDFFRKADPRPEYVELLSANDIHATEKSQPEDRMDKHSVALSNELRESLRHVTQPVALLTSTSPIKTLPAPHSKKDEMMAKNRGVTVSSLTTVTMKPKPIICFNLKVPSRTWDAIRASGKVGAYLLTATPDGAAAANLFTKPYELPHTPFMEIQKLGYWVGTARDGLRPPKLKGKAFYTAIFADILQDKCVRVADHVVVLAEVTNVTRFDESEGVKHNGALAYGMQNFRGMGGEIQPLQAPNDEAVVEEEQDRTSAADAGEDGSQAAAPEAVDKERSDNAHPTRKPPKVDKTQSEKAEPKEAKDLKTPKWDNTNSENAKSKEAKDLKPSAPFLDAGSSRQLMDQPESSYNAEGLPSQTASKEPVLNEALQALSRAWDAASDPPVDPEPHPDFQPAWRSVDAPDTPPIRRQLQTKKNAAKNAPPDTEAESQSQQEPETQWKPTEGAKPLPPFRVRSHYAKSEDMFYEAKHGVQQPPQNREFSTWTRPQFRHYSTKSAHPAIPKSILNLTVGEYLVPIAPHRKKYYKLLLTHNRAEWLETNFLKRDNLTAEEATKAREELETLRRDVGKDIAVRNAHDLRLLLDENRLHLAKAPWLESQLEQGQAIMLIEAKMLRSALSEGKVRIDEFDEVKEKMTRDYDLIETQLRRLRECVLEDDVVDEDEDD